jgi:hypothetical protein
MSERLDVHAVRHRLKLLRDTGDTALYENREGVECPACGEPFDELLVIERSTRSFDPDRPVAFCLVRESDRMLLCTHDAGGNRRQPTPETG